MQCNSDQWLLSGYDLVCLDALVTCVVGDMQLFPYNRLSLECTWLHVQQQDHNMWPACLHAADRMLGSCQMTSSHWLLMLVVLAIVVLMAWLAIVHK